MQRSFVGGKVVVKLGSAKQAFAFETDAGGAVAAGIISATGAASWFVDLEQCAPAGRFFSARLGFAVSGRKP
jgi:hypothetical protein